MWGGRGRERRRQCCVAYMASAVIVHRMWRELRGDDEEGLGSAAGVNGLLASESLSHSS